jgi:hypothetical protein
MSDTDTLGCCYNVPGGCERHRDSAPMTRTEREMTRSLRWGQAGMGLTPEQVERAGRVFAGLGEGIPAGSYAVPLCPHSFGGVCPQCEKDSGPSAPTRRTRAPSADELWAATERIHAETLRPTAYVVGQCACGAEHTHPLTHECGPVESLAPPPAVR